MTTSPGRHTSPSFTVLLPRAAQLLREFDEITSDHITAYGTIAVDPDRVPNGRQNAIGALFNHLRSAGYIELTGRSVLSRAPYGRGRRIQVWRVTDAGRRWAEQYLARLL